MDPDVNPYSAGHQQGRELVTHHASPAGQKPVSATVFGVLHLVFGIMGLLFSPLNFLFVWMIESGEGPPNLVWDLMRQSPGYMLFYKASLVFWMLFSAVLVAAGIGLLRGQGWGRTLSLLYGWISIVVAVFGFVANYFLLLEPLSQLDGPEAMGGYIGGLVGGILGLVGGMAYPIATLIFMQRRNVVDYFRHQTTGVRYG